MAKSDNSLLLHNVRGQIGKQIVVRKYGKNTVISAYPDMSNIKPSRLQKEKRKSFAEAVAYARAINNDPVKKALYKKKVKKGQRVFNYAIKEFLRKGKK
jgi:hypothetical protein